MPQLEFRRVKLHVRNFKPPYGEEKPVATLNMPSPLRYTARWFEPEPDAPDKGITNIEFYTRLQTAVFRHPKSDPSSVKPDIARQGQFNTSVTNRGLPVEMAREFPLGNLVCALIRANDMPERLLAVPFTSLAETVVPVASPELVEKFTAAKEQDYSPEACQAIGKALTHDVFLVAFADALPTRTA